MTKKEFVYAISRGLGRGYIAVRENPEKYRNEVIKTLSKCPAFDPQCEGTRAQYSYAVFKCYEDADAFRDIIIKSFLRLPNTDLGWNTAYYAEILCGFSTDGDIIAKNALDLKFSLLYSDLMKKRKLPNGRFPERDNFESIAVSVCVNISAYRKIANDIGLLYKNNRLYDGSDFLWFQSCFEGYYVRVKKSKSKTEGINEFINAVEAEKIKQENENREREKDPVYRAEREKRRKSYFERELFVEISLPKSREELIDFLQNIQIDREDKNGWHRFHSDIFKALNRKNYPRYLKEALPIIYKTTLCSFCRERAFCEMLKRKMVIQNLLSESLYDSNENIRKIAGRKVKQKK